MRPGRMIVSAGVVKALSACSLVGVLLVGAGGCSPPPGVRPHIQHGARYRGQPEAAYHAKREIRRIYAPFRQFKKGFPVAAVHGLGYVDLHGDPTLLVAAGIDRTNLDYPSGDTAIVAIRTRVRGPGKIDTTVRKVLQIPRRSRGGPYRWHTRLHLPPGHYRVRVWLFTQSRGRLRASTRTVRVSVPNPQGDTSPLGPIRMAVKGEHRWAPLASYSLSGHPDSLRFTVHVALDSTDRSRTIHARLLRFRADTSITPIIFNSGDPKGTLIYKGIDYHDSTLVHGYRRTLPAGAIVQIRFQLPAPARRGDYRFVVRAGGGHWQARDFAVRPPGFPLLRTPQERAAALAYLMKPAAWKALMVHSDPDSLAVAVSRFWRDTVSDSNRARQVAVKYYRRAAVANRLFSNYKEGWKTDRGMIYMLFGPPHRIIYNYHDIIPIAWVYGGWFGFGFYQPRAKSEAFPFQQIWLRPPHNNNYSHYYSHYDWFQFQRQLWRSGNILQKQYWYQ